MRTRFLSTLAAFTVFAASSVGLAQPALITAPQTISATATTITPTAGGPAVPLTTAEITVQGTTLTINGRHAIASLMVQRNAANVAGVVTHSANFSYDYSGGAGTDVVNGLWLVVSGNVDVEGLDGALVASSIDVTGCGYPMANGPGAGGSDTHTFTIGGGGGYGGNGANGAGFTAAYALGGRPYGSYSQPTDLGSGSGQANYPGAAGGGAVRLIVDGTLTVNGALRSNGVVGGGTNAASGSGGSIWVTAGTLTGTGQIQASGMSSPDGRGAGGGGRIALYVTSLAFSGVEQALGGSGTNGRGGAGTLYHVINGGTPQLIYDNGGGSLGNTEPVGDVLTCTGDVIVRGHAVLAHAPASTQGLSINVTGTLTVEADGSIDVTGCGYPVATGPGAGDSSALICSVAGGGAYGGRGARGTIHCYSHPDPSGGWDYGSFAVPTDLGSGAGAGNYPSGPGGGAVKVVVSGTFTLDGVVRSNGQGGPDVRFASGSGGSIWLTAGSLTGAGMIQAHGVGSSEGSGAGGGGRIAIYTCSQQLPVDHITAAGVRGLLAASESGSVFFSSSSAAFTLHPTSRTTCPSTAAFDVSVVSAGGVLYHWQIIDPSTPSGWSDLSEGPFIRGGQDYGQFAGTQTPTLTWNAIYGPGNTRGYFDSSSGQLRCVVGASCSQIVSNIATLAVCLADLDDGSGTGSCDGGIDINDLLYFLVGFEAGSSAVDLDDGSATGTPDGGVDINDLLFFLVHFEAGC